jgi:hypothetical protein
VDEAARIMRLLTDRGCEPGRDYDDSSTQSWFAEAGLEDEEIEQGLMTAVDRGWLIMPPERPGNCQITQAGFDAATAA